MDYTSQSIRHTVHTNVFVSDQYENVHVTTAALHEQVNLRVKK